MPGPAGARRDLRRTTQMAIIVGLSDTPLGRLAIERAAREAGSRKQPLVLTVGVPMRRNQEDAQTYPERRREAEEQLQQKSDQLRATGIEVIPHLPPVPKSAAEAILDAAREHDAELIVVGIRRRSPVGKAFLGSTSQDVLLEAECEVLGVKLPQDAD
jgi:nucleotide-binding universal stress UspA family protein